MKQYKKAPVIKGEKWNEALKEYFSNGKVGVCPFCNSTAFRVEVLNGPIKMCWNFVCDDCKAWRHIDGIIVGKQNSFCTPVNT